MRSDPAREHNLGETRVRRVFCLLPVRLPITLHGQNAGDTWYQTRWLEWALIRERYLGYEWHEWDAFEWAD